MVKLGGTNTWMVDVVHEPALRGHAEVQRLARLSLDPRQVAETEGAAFISGR